MPEPDYTLNLRYFEWLTHTSSGHNKGWSLWVLAQASAWQMVAVRRWGSLLVGTPQSKIERISDGLTTAAKWAASKRQKGYTGGALHHASANIPFWNMPNLFAVLYRLNALTSYHQKKPFFVRVNLDNPQLETHYETHLGYIPDIWRVDPRGDGAWGWGPVAPDGGIYILKPEQATTPALPPPNTNPMADLLHIEWEE